MVKHFFIPNKIEDKRKKREKFKTLHQKSEKGEENTKCGDIGSATKMRNP